MRGRQSQALLSDSQWQAQRHWAQTKAQEAPSVHKTLFIVRVTKYWSWLPTSPVDIAESPFLEILIK